jgi:hypothetical protein
VVGTTLSLIACQPTGDPHDTTPPEFLQMTVTVERVSDGFEEPAVDATAGLTLDDVQRNRRIILQATVADDQSGIKQVRLDGDTSWDCITPGEDLAENKHGTLGGPPDEERQSGTVPPGRPAARNVTFTLDPFSGNAQRLVCPSSDLSTELLMEVTLVSSNGNDLEVTSPVVSIEYQPRPPG